MDSQLTKRSLTTVSVASMQENVGRVPSCPTPTHAAGLFPWPNLIHPQIQTITRVLKQKKKITPTTAKMGVRVSFVL